MPLINEFSDLLKSTVLVANLPFSVTEREIMYTLNKVGHIKQVNMMTYPDSYEDESKRGKFRGIGFWS